MYDLTSQVSALGSQVANADAPDKGIEAGRSDIVACRNGRWVLLSSDPTAASAPVSGSESYGVQSKESYHGLTWSPGPAMRLKANE